jgi:nucleotide-binding universal stress UspA family protein
MKILFAYDGSEGADKAIATAATLLGHDNADVVVLTVWEPLTVEAVHAARFGGWAAVPTNVAEVDENAEHQAQRLAEYGAGLAGDAGFAARAQWVADERRIADAIVQGAGELNADLIVMGARGLTGLSAFFGSVSTHVLHHTSQPVLVVPLQKAPTPDGPGVVESARRGTQPPLSQTQAHPDV